MPLCQGLSTGPCPSAFGLVPGFSLRDVITATRQLGADVEDIVNRLVQDVVPPPTAANRRQFGELVRLVAAVRRDHASELVGAVFRVQVLQDEVLYYTEEEDRLRRASSATNNRTPPPGVWATSTSSWSRSKHLCGTEAPYPLPTRRPTSTDLCRKLCRNSYGSSIMRYSSTVIASIAIAVVAFGIKRLRARAKSRGDTVMGICKFA